MVEQEASPIGNGSLVEEMRKTGNMNHVEKAEHLEAIVQEAAQETRLQEEEMKAQEAEDDADLRELKAKLQTAQAKPRPDNKDEMIEYLTERLEAATAAIEISETIIEHERKNRKEMSGDLKERNATLKELIANEKKSLTEKVNNELDATLSMAVREKVQTQELYAATMAELQRKNSEFDQLSLQFDELKKKSDDQEQESVKQQQMIVKLEEQVMGLQSNSASLQRAAIQAKEDNDRAQAERAEACTAVIKLDEARILLNKLLGPQGPLSMAERHKYLSAQGAAEQTSISNTINDKSGQFYTNTMPQEMNAARASAAAETVKSSRGQPREAPKGDDDEFWYQTPKNPDQFAGAFQQQ